MTCSEETGRRLCENCRSGRKSPRAQGQALMRHLSDMFQEVANNIFCSIISTKIGSLPELAQK